MTPASRDLGPFVPAPIPDLDQAAIRGVLRAAWELERRRFGAHVRGHAGGEELDGEGAITSTTPANPSTVVGTAAIARQDEVEAAFRAAWAAFDGWRASGDERRVELLLAVAERMRARAAELAALVVLEAGKSWDEGTGEVAESIDFLEYHARQLHQVRQRSASALERHPLERNRYRYLPLGAGVAMTPWPFPIAQFTGMVSAALVTGNTVVVKPASLAPMTSRRVFDVWREAGTPDGVLNLLFGPGAQVGRALARHPRTRFVTLTGSAATGVAVAAAAAERDPRRRWFTRVVLELSGKNPVVVDESADLDAAAAGVVAGAFSFQGQKCSAGSRLIVVSAVHDALVERVVALAEALRVGDPSEFGTQVGPLIDEEALERVQRFVDMAHRDARVVTGGTLAAHGGRTLLPTVVSEVAPDHPLAREEILGPVLTVLEVPDLETAFDVANDSPYGLTGSFYGRDPDRMARAIDTMRVGSLYLNRKPTASEVGFHPFGGFGLSGTDAKAGGPDYLFQFLQAQTITVAEPR